MREMFGLVCLALMVPKSEKMSPPSNRTGYIIETINAVDDYAKRPGVFAVPLSPPPPQEAGFLPLLFMFLNPVISLLSDEIVNTILGLMLSYGVFLVARVFRRMRTAAFRGIFGGRVRERENGGDLTLATRQSQGEIDDLSRSTPVGNPTTTPNELNTEANIHDASGSLPLQAVTAVSYNPISRRHIKTCWNGFLVLTRLLLAATMYILRATANATYRFVRLWFNAEEIQSSSAEIPSNTPLPPTAEQILAEVQADSARKDEQIIEKETQITKRDEQITRKDDRISRLSKAANASLTTIANLNRSNSRLLSGIRKTLDPRGLYPDKTNVLTIANHARRDFKRVSKKVLRQRKDLESSNAHQESDKLLHKALEVARLFAENERLRGSVLGLELGQQSSIKAVERIKQEAKRREKKLKDQQIEAQRKLSDAIDPRTHETLRNHFDLVRDGYFRAREERNAANAALKAVRPEAQEQSDHQVTVEKDAVQDVIDLVAELKPKTEAEDEKMKEAKRKTQEAETKAQEAEAKAQAAETKAQDAEDRVQRAKARAEAAEQSKVTIEEDLQDARDAARESSQHQLLMEQRIRSLEEARPEPINVAQEAIPVSTQSASQQEASTQTEHAADNALNSYHEGRQDVIRECEQEALVLIANAVSNERQSAQRQLGTALQEERQQAQQQLNTAIANRESLWIAEVNAQMANELARSEGPLRAQLTTATQQAIAAGERANEAEQRFRAESSRADNAEEELRRQKAATSSQEGQLNIYRGEIANLKRKIPRNADFMAAQLRSATDGRLRAHALIRDYLSHHYGWQTRQLLARLFTANERIMEFERMLEDPETRSSQLVFLKALLDAEVPREMFMERDEPLSQVIVKQCKAVNVLLDALKTIINGSDQPDKVRLLTEMYKSRGDEDTVDDTEDSPSEPSSDEDEDDDRARAQTPAPDAPRNRLVPTSRRARPAAVPQAQDPPVPSDSRGNPHLKRKEADDLEASTSSKRRDAPHMEMRPIAQGSLPPTAANDPIATEPAAQNGVSSSERSEAPATQPQSNDQTNIIPQLPSLPAQHPFSPNPIPSSQTPSHAPHSQPEAVEPASAQEMTASSSALLSTNFSFTQPQSEPASTQDMTASPSALPSTSFSFTVPKNIATGIRPHVRKYTRLSRVTNILPSPRQSLDTSCAEQ